MPRRRKAKAVAPALETAVKVEADDNQSTPMMSTAVSPLPALSGVIYPPGCKPITKKMSLAELIRVLKTIAGFFQALGQDDPSRERYVPLCCFLTERTFLNHSSKDVRLLIACIIADIFRSYSPEAPYTDSDHLGVIFKFLISQLEGLKDLKSSSFKRYFYLLENLTFVKTFRLCLKMDNYEDILYSLAKRIFSVITDDHSYKVRAFMLDLLSPLIEECDNVSNELMDVILTHISEGVKTTRKNAYELAKNLIIKCEDTLGSYFQNFLNLVLTGRGDEFANLSIAPKVVDLIYELQQICPSSMRSVIPQIKCKFTSIDEKERLGAVSLMARLFSEKDSTFGTHYSPLWQAYLQRFIDKAPAVRIKCVQSSMNIVLCHPRLRNDIVEVLKARSHDPDENVRFEVVKVITATVNKDIDAITESGDLLEILRGRSRDEKFRIRKKVLTGLGLVYKGYLDKDSETEVLKEAVKWIRNTILNTYYMHIEDQSLVEKLLNSCLVPFQKESSERMMILVYLFASLDSHAVKAFIEMQKTMSTIRNNLSELIQLVKNSKADAEKEKIDKELSLCIGRMTKFLPDGGKGSEFLGKLFFQLKKDEEMLRVMEVIVDPESNCKDCVKNTNAILKKLGPHTKTNSYQNTVRLLIERSSSVLIDKEAVGNLMEILESVVKGDGEVLTNLGINKCTGLDKVSCLVTILSSIFPAQFCSEGILHRIVKLIKGERGREPLTTNLVMSLWFVGKVKPLGTCYPDVMAKLSPLAERILSKGKNPTQGKRTVQCMMQNLKENKKQGFFKGIVKTLEGKVGSDEVDQEAAIVVLGQIALFMGEEVKTELKEVMSKKVSRMVDNPKKGRDLNASRSQASQDQSWCFEEDLPPETKSLIAGIKAITRWVIGLHSDLKLAEKAFNMLYDFIQPRAEMEEQFSKSERAWLRLTGGCCMLKLCAVRGIGDQFTAPQFYSLAMMMNDEVFQVRYLFAKKLDLKLSGNLESCLPPAFMGLYVLAGYEPDRKHKALLRTYLSSAVEKRRDYIKSLVAKTPETANSKAQGLMPELMLPHAVAILTHNSKFTCSLSRQDRMEIKQCLRFILEPLMSRKNSENFGCLTQLFQALKRQKTAFDSDKEEAQLKMHAVCDIGSCVVLEISACCDSDFQTNNHVWPIPSLHFQPHETQTIDSSKIGVAEDTSFTTGPKDARVAFATPENKQRRPKRKMKLTKEEESVESQPVGGDFQPQSLQASQPSDASQEQTDVDEGSPPPPAKKKRTRKNSLSGLS